MIYYRFDADTSNTTEVYDEGFGGITGVRMPICGPTRWRPSRTTRQRGGVPPSACVAPSRPGTCTRRVLGHRGSRQPVDRVPPNSIWRRDRMHESSTTTAVTGRVSGYQIRGRVKGEDVIIGITGIETFRTDDMILD